MVSADGRRAGFTGVTLGRSRPYGVVAEAVCAQGIRHRSPSRWCDCGFYCFHRCDDARALSCEPRYRGCVMLQVQASGRYICYEKGLRYARQRITAVSVGPCGCGQSAALFADADDGVVGWRRLVPSCGTCLRSRPVFTLEEFGALAGGIPVGSDGPAIRVTGQRLGTTDDELVPLLSAEVAVLHARLDQLQSQLDRLTHGHN